MERTRKHLNSSVSNMNGKYPVSPSYSICRICSLGYCLGHAFVYILCEWFAKCPRVCFIVTCMLIILFYVNRSPWNIYFKNWIWYDLNSDLTGWVKMKKSQQAVMRGLIGETPLLFHSLSILSFFEGMALWDNSNAARLNLNHLRASESDTF